MKLMSPPSEIIKRGKHVVQAGADLDIADRLRAASEASLYIFAKAICSMTEFSPNLHKPVCDSLMNRKGKRHGAWLLPRSTFKTSMARCLGIHITIQAPDKNPYFPNRDGKNLRILFAAETEKRAQSRIAWIRRQYENNELLRALWPELCPWSNPKHEAPMWTASHFALNRNEDYTEGTFESAGVDSGSTGSHYDVTIKDDLIGLRSRQDPALMPRAIEWFQTSHSLTVDLTTTLDYVFGTRWAAFDLYSWMQENENYTWDVKQIIDDEFSPSSILFPERFQLGDILDLQKKNGELFWLNYMNKPFGEGLTAFNMKKANYFSIDENGQIVYEEAEATTQMLGIIERGGVREEKPKVKQFWEMTGEERNQRWQEMQRNWYARKLTEMEVL